MPAAKRLRVTIQLAALVTADERFRRMYYFASYRFVKFLIARAGMETFLKLYDSSDPEAEFPKLYGATRAELVAMAGM